MFVAADHMRTVRVRAKSPDGTVTATMTAETGVRLSLEPGSLKHHSVESLAEAVRSAVKGALDGYRRAGDEVLRRERGEDVLETMWNSQAGGQLRPFFDALDRVDVNAASGRDVVKVRLKDGRLGVKFHSRALNLHEGVLAEEIDRTIEDMYGKRSAEAERLYEELVSYPEGVT